MSTTTTIQAEASKPQKKMQECNRCKAAGFPNQLIGFEKIGEDPVTGKINWKLIDENGEQPHMKCARFVEPIDGAKGAKESVLYDILRISVVT